MPAPNGFRRRMRRARWGGDRFRLGEGVWAAQAWAISLSCLGVGQQRQEKAEGLLLRGLRPPH